MAWIKTLNRDEADGELARIYRKAAAPDDPVDQILTIHALHPRSLADHLSLYKTLMYGPGPLTRAERETVAVAVSAANACHY